MNNKNESKVTQTSRVFKSTKDCINKVSDKFERTYPTTVVSLLLEKVFSSDFTMQQALDEVTNLKTRAMELDGTLQG